MRLSGLQGGRYRIVRQLGRGGMGAVYMAQDRELFDRPCVIKEMLNIYQSAAEREKAEEDFRREGQLLARLNQPGHPNIPEIYGHFVEEERHYLVIKYIAGENLEERHERLGRAMSEQEVIQIMLPICDALVYMHAQTPPVIHRDIKPANIIFGEDGRVWLVDFGLAKATLSGGALIAREGRTMAMGTPGYTPPEQWQSSPQPASDIYALGATMHHLLTGRDPREQFAEYAQLTMQIVKSLSIWPRLREIRPEVSEEMDELVARALADNPARRPTASQMRQELQTLARDAADPLTRTIRRVGPSVGRSLGLALAIFFQRLFWGAPADRTGSRRSYRRRSLWTELFTEPEVEQPKAKTPAPARACRLCDGTGVVLGNIRCPVCGGTGRW
jgi:serine/threonine protein kinase